MSIKIRSIRNTIGRNYRYRRAIEAARRGNLVQAAGHGMLALAEYQLILRNAAEARASYAGALLAWSTIERY